MQKQLSSIRLNVVIGKKSLRPPLLCTPAFERFEVHQKGILPKPLANRNAINEQSLCSYLR
jgi:hypothetical protein